MKNEVLNSSFKNYISFNDKISQIKSQIQIDNEKDLERWLIQLKNFSNNGLIFRGCEDASYKMFIRKQFYSVGKISIMHHYEDSNLRINNQDDPFKSLNWACKISDKNTVKNNHFDLKNYCSLYFINPNRLNCSINKIISNEKNSLSLVPILNRYIISEKLI